jgi:NADH-quinone oxidoreductase subunit J
MNAIFYIAAAVTLISSIMAITNRNAIHALLFLILSLLAISIIFYISGAPFIAALEVIVYAGAIMVLFIFVVMMLNVGMEEELENKWLKKAMWIAPIVISAILLLVFIYAVNGLNAASAQSRVISPREVGVSLFTTYLIGVEISAIMLLAGIVGSYHLGRRKKKFIHRFLRKEEETVELTKTQS